MTILECFEVCNDSQIQKFVGGKMVKVKYKDGLSKIGLVTNFINAAVADDVNRAIIGFTLDKNDDIIVSSATIDDISILN